MSAADAGAPITDRRGNCRSRYAIGGSASEASTDPSEMYLGDPDAAATKIASAGEHRERRQHRRRRRMPSRRPCRRETAATPGRCVRRSRPAPAAAGAAVMSAKPGARPSSTLTAPFAMSSTATRTPAVTPDARNTFAAPRFPLPTRRRSSTPQRRRAAAQRDRSDRVRDEMTRVIGNMSGGCAIQRGVLAPRAHGSPVARLDPQPVTSRRSMLSAAWDAWNFTCSRPPMN